MARWRVVRGDQITYIHSASVRPAHRPVEVAEYGFEQVFGQHASTTFGATLRTHSPERL